ncbi:hypothetical protein [Natrinema pallidum]|uniref:hypothetical protein n=1 Tax=Natrinema pallidum TaxID=69527 RepID=UPI00126899EC|nr:hypothetical protein [Natrinema pallidum]
MSATDADLYKCRLVIKDVVRGTGGSVKSADISVLCANLDDLYPALLGIFLCDRGESRRIIWNEAVYGCKPLKILLDSGVNGTDCLSSMVIPLSNVRIARPASPVVTDSL